MTRKTSTTVFDLLDPEVETLRRAALAKGLPFDPDRRTYTAEELDGCGLVREAFNSDELADWGLDNARVVTSFDPIVEAARDELIVDAPFASTVRKWQLPIDLSESRSLMSEFPPDSFVEPHVHPANTEENPGGSLRMVLSGEISYAGRVFGPGDWFYIPNGIAYSFRTHAANPTRVFYCYAFFAPSMGNRLSYPLDLAQGRTVTTAVA